MRQGILVDTGETFDIPGNDGMLTWEPSGPTIRVLSAPSCPTHLSWSLAWWALLVVLLVTALIRRWGK